MSQDFVACLVTMGAASHRTARQRGGLLAPKKGFWTWMTFGLIAVTAGNFLMKFKDSFPHPGHSLSFVVFRCWVGAAALAAACRVGGVRLTVDRRTVRIGVLFGAFFLANLLVMLEGVKRLDISVFFPVMAGSAILAGEILTVVTRERPSRLAYLGAAFAVAAVVLVNVDW